MMRLLLISLVPLAALAGCSNTTETGYKPRALDDSETVQRGYYATPFSPEARDADVARRARVRTETGYQAPLRSGR